MISTPLYDALIGYVRKNTRRFHMPGHKGKDILFSGILKDLALLDVTELPETDNLASPGGVIKEAECLAAKAFGSQNTFFLTCGSTLGNLAMITAAVGEGEKILVDRNAHISVFSALALCGGTPVYMEGAPPDCSGAFGAIEADAVHKYILANKDARAVFITSPNVFGITADLKRISRLCKEHNMYLLVDEAHGAHFSFHPALPRSAMESGADAAVQSFHKTLPSLTMAAVLHSGNAGLCGKLDRALRLYHTSSPSYPIMASIDLARAYMENEGFERLNQLIKVIEENPSENLFTCDKKDVLRLVFKCDGYKSAKILEQESIVPEMYGAGFVVCIVTAADEPCEVLHLLKTARTLPIAQYSDVPPPRSKVILTPRQTYKAGFESIPAGKAVGRVCKTAVYRYPPGVPIIAPGEEITAEAVEYIDLMTKRGDAFCGVTNGNYEVI